MPAGQRSTRVFEITLTGRRYANSPATLRTIQGKLTHDPDVAPAGLVFALSQILAEKSADLFFVHSIAIHVSSES